MKALWLYLHFPHLQLDSLFSAVTQDHDKVAEHPPIVILQGKKNAVVQLNQAAADAGIRHGMGLGTAAALANDLQVLEYEYQTEQNKLREIAEHLYQITSDICLFPPDGLLLRIHNMLNLYGGLQPYWRVIRSQLAFFPLSYHYSTGLSPYAARMLARTQQDQISDEVEHLRQLVANCPISHSELDSKTIHKLQRVGVHKLTDLLALPMKDIAKRFDIDVVTYLGRLTAEFHHPVNFYHPQSGFQRYVELLYEISHSQTLQRPMQQLLNALEHFLKIRDLLTQKIIFRLIPRDADPLTLEVGSAQGEYKAAKWLELTALKLEKLILTAPVYGIGLTTGDTQLRCPQKADLFSASKGTLNSLQLISLLQAKLGEQAIRQITLENDIRPEYSSKYTPPYLHNNKTNLSLQAVRPSFLMSCPQPLCEQVKIVSGPERISTGWWDNRAVVRDYFIARSALGQWLWIFKTAEAKWFVHGLFS